MNEHKVGTQRIGCFVSAEHLGDLDHVLKRELKEIGNGPVNDVSNE